MRSRSETQEATRQGRTNSESVNRPAHETRTRLSRVGRALKMTEEREQKKIIIVPSNARLQTRIFVAEEMRDERSRSSIISSVHLASRNRM